MSTKETKIINKVKIVDLDAQYETIKMEINEAISKVLASSNFILGPSVQSFEEELANYLKCKYVVSCGNGTDAIILALKALDIGTGDEVITVSHSYFATSEAIAQIGAVPVFCDIREDDYNIDPVKIKGLITKKTKAIIPVHIYGQSCEIKSVVDLANKQGLFVIEDCAQALGARYEDKLVGTFGNIGTTSFYPTKNLGAYGDGGAIFTNDLEIAKEIKLLRTHGSNKRYVHELIGFNSRLDELQAAVLRVKLKYLDKWNSLRREAADYYTFLFKDITEVKPPCIKPNCNHIFHQYTIRVPNRNKLQEELDKAYIDTLIYYPIPIHKQKAFLHLGKTNLPVTEKVCDEILSLPIYPEIKKDIQQYVVETIKQFFEKSI